MGYGATNQVRQTSYLDKVGQFSQGAIGAAGQIQPDTTTSTPDAPKTAGGVVASAGAGAAAGATVGTATGGPGWGTAIGAVAGLAAYYLS